MSPEKLPLADVAIAISSIALNPDLTLSGIDLDSGQTIKIQISSDDPNRLATQLMPVFSSLVVVLTLYADVASLDV